MSGWVWATSPRICLKFRLSMETNKKSYLWRKRKGMCSPVCAIPAHLQSKSTHRKGPGATWRESHKGQTCLLIRERIPTAPWTLCEEISIWILSLAFSYFFRSFPTWLLPEDLGGGKTRVIARFTANTCLSVFTSTFDSDVFTSSPFYIWPFGLCPLSWLSSSN